MGYCCWILSGKNPGELAGPNFVPGELNPFNWVEFNSEMDYGHFPSDALF